MKAIPLTHGAVTVVDDEDFDRFGHLKWWLSGCGHAATTIRNPDRTRSTLFLHRAIMGAGPGEDVHHKDEDPLNNQKANLETVEHGRHRAGHARRAGPRTGKYKGVQWVAVQQAWRASINTKGKTYNLGTFRTAELAALAYNKAALAAFGPDCYQNSVASQLSLLDDEQQAA
jgi:hypothetical protein